MYFLTLHSNSPPHPRSAFLNWFCQRIKPNNKERNYFLNNPGPSGDAEQRGKIHNIRYSPLGPEPRSSGRPLWEGCSGVWGRWKDKSIHMWWIKEWTPGNFPGSSVVKTPCSQTSLVAQWMRLCLPMQETQVRSLVWEDPICHGATKLMCHHSRACNSRDCKLQLPSRLQVATTQSECNYQSPHCSEKSAHYKEEWPPLAATRESPCKSNEDPAQPKIN